MADVKFSEHEGSGAKNYIGVKMVRAWPESREGQEGYGIAYPDRHISWCPRDVFEKAYFLVSQQNSLSHGDIERFIDGYHDSKVGDKTTVVSAVLQNGSEITETSSPVHPDNYDHQVGRDVCMDRIQDKVWSLLVFVLCWARWGLNPAVAGEKHSGFREE